MMERKSPDMETNREDISDQGFHFPDELLLEILLKLPAKSTYRFRSVSRNWFSLISDPSFLHDYVSRSKDSPPFALIFQGGNYKAMRCLISARNIFSSPFPSDQIPGLKVEATSHDLILYQSNCRLEPAHYLVANPFTRQCVTLPMHGRRKSYGYKGLIPHVRNGITSYNVVRVIKEYDNIDGFSDAGRPLDLEIFSSQRGEWRNFKATNCAFNVEVDARPCVVFKGILHWICNRMTALLAYDPCSSPDKCWLISIPSQAYNMNGMNATVGVSGEHLYYFEMSSICIQERKLPGWKLWVMKDYERGGWSLDREGKERKIDSMGVLCTVLSTHSPLLPVAFHPWNKDVVYFWYEGNVLTFDVRKGWFEDESFVFSCESMVLASEIFSLWMPLCPTRLPEPQWDGKLAMLQKC